MDGKARRDAFGRRELLVLSALGLVAGAPRTAFAGSPQGQLTWAVHFSLAPTWFDPAETPGMITPFLLMYALHDAMVKPMPGNAAEPCLAEAWKMAPDGLSYEFTVRAGAKFHNGEPVTAEDVKFSFERYRGTSAALMKERVAAVETPDERRVRFVLKKPWPDFLTFYSSATGAGWIVPKKYVQQVGEDGFKKAPIGAGPYKFVSFTPGVELVFEAFDGYWRKTPAVKRLVFKVVPEEATRLAALKRGEVDIAYSIRGELAEELKKTPGLTLKPVVIQGTFWLYFPDQWDPKSPWHDQRVRDAARLAHRLQVDLRGADARLLADHQQHHPRQLRLLLEGAGGGVRPRQGQEAAGRRGLPQRLRCRRLLLQFLLRQSRRGGDQQPPGSRHPREAAAARARRLLQRLFREEAQEHHPGLVRRVRQRGDAAGSLRGQGRRLRLWQLSRDRHAVRRAGGRARRRQAHRHAAPHPADPAREARSTRRSGSSPSSTAWASAWANPPSA